MLPRGTGKTVRVAVFAQGANAEKAKAAGADIVGFDDLAEKIKGGFMDFDVVIASPDAMKVVGPLGQVLGPRGLMPNPKVGTVTPNVDEAVKNAKGGQVQYRADKAGIVQCTIGRASFEVDALAENLEALMGAINKAKPASTKGIYLKKVSVSSTMGVGVRVDQTGIGRRRRPPAAAVTELWAAAALQGGRRVIKDRRRPARDLIEGEHLPKPTQMAHPRQDFPQAGSWREVAMS